VNHASRDDPREPAAERRNRRHALIRDVVALCALTILICFLRRPDQFLHPYIWDEDGTLILKAYAERGLASVTEVNGYLILTARLFSLAAFKTSFLWAPEISAVLAVGFTCAVVVAIALSPTVLPRPYLCAIVPLIVPSEPEVFAVALYSFWWAGLLLLLVLMWDASRGKIWLRIAYTVIAGLSSPLIVPFAAILWLRAVIERRLSEFATAAVASAVAAVQAAAVMSSELVPHRPFPDPLPIADTFAGVFLSTPRNWLSEDHPGLIVLAVLALAAWLARRRLRWEIILLALAWVAVCVSVYLRLGDVHGLSPIGPGPRYFFYPLVIMIWIGLWIGIESHRFVRGVLTFGLVLALVTAARFLTHFDDRVDWRSEVLACTRADTYALSIHFNGRREELWHLTLTGAQCRRMLDASLFGPAAPR